MRTGAGSVAAATAPSPVKFPPHSTLREALTRRVDAYFAETGKPRTGGVGMVLKSAILLVWASSSYLALVFLVETWWQAGIAAASMGVAVAGIGFNIQHDGAHGSYSRGRWGNRLAAWTLDVIGGSSYLWHCKHNVLHHHFTNVSGVDDDLQAEPFLRLEPRQPRYWFHRFQHFYVWPLYAVIPPKWQWYDDFKQLVTARIGDQPIPRAKGWVLAGFFIGKAAFVAWAIVLPFALHPPGAVVLTYAVICLVMGVTMGTVFQLAHCIEEAEFEDRPAANERLTRSWAEHQLATTVDFSPRSRVLCWYLGGLNFQVEHHLFPKISHRHYPALAPLVRDVCAASGVPHRSHPTVWKALASHVRHMRRLGRAA